MMIFFGALVIAGICCAAIPSLVTLREAYAITRSNRPTFERAVPRVDDSEPLDDKIELETVNADAFSQSALSRDQSHAKTKRMIDIAASLGLVVFFAPLLALTIIAIKLDSKGPAFYRQRRVGKNGREFDVLKFRSMQIDAEQDGPQYARQNDNRITRVGRFIRRTRIDEIPQAINVLRGDMSFVGPRPERPEFVRDLEQKIPNYHCRHLIKPGITGWAQVKYEYAASVEGAREKLRYDLYYVGHASPWLDLTVILKTFRVALFGIGSR